MFRPKMFEKPSGVKDYLPDTVTRLRAIEQNVLACMRSWGYRELITPTLEYYDTVGAASSTHDSKLFKLLDKKGTSVVLRSDLTAPIARVVSSVMKDEPLPLRIAYHANVFRAFEEEAGRQAEFFQTGVELVGDSSSEADAEIVALAIASLKAAGVENFKIAIGHVGFLNGLFHETLSEYPEVQQQLKDDLLNRDHVGYRHRLRSLPISEEAKAELKSILRLRGGYEICDQALAITHDEQARAALSHLCEMWDVFDAYGITDYVLIDLTMISDFSYYTGMTFEGYAGELGFPVCSGGRYDNLLQQFGRPASATGFALKTNRILEVVSDQPLEHPEQIVIVYDAENRKKALQHAQALRETNAAGKQVIVETRYVKNRHEAGLNQHAEDQKRIEFLSE